MVEAIMIIAARNGCHQGTAVPVDSLKIIVIGQLGGKKLNAVATIPLGSRTATNQTITGAISIIQTGNSKD